MLKFKFMKGILRTPCIRDERYRERSTTVHDSCMLKKVHGWTDDVILGVQMVIDIVYYISPPMYIQPSSTIFQKEPLNKTTLRAPKTRLSALSVEPSFSTPSHPFHSYITAL